MDPVRTYFYVLVLFFLNRVFSEGQGFVLVYSVTSRFSFENLEVFHRSMRRVKGGNPIFMLVGTQCDRTQDREVSKADGAALARKFGCDFIETSAKTTQNIERLFINLIRSLRQTLDTESKQEPHQSAKKERESHAIVLFCRTFSGFAKLLAVSVCVDFRVKFPSLCFFFVVNLFHLYLAIFSRLLTCVRDGISKECQPSSLSSPISRVTWRFSTEQGSVGKIIY